MATGDWVLAIDFGTSFTAVAAQGPGGIDEVVEIDNQRAMPSAVFWSPLSDGGSRLLVGDEALNAAELAPGSLERCPKRRMGEGYMTLGGHRVQITDAIGEILRYAAVEARRRHGATDPGEVRLTHPARWRGLRLRDLMVAAQVAGFPPPKLVPEPVGAALFFATEKEREGQLRDGDHVAVYDLGGGTFDTAVLEYSGQDFEVVKEPGGNPDLGGEDFDDRLYNLLGSRLEEEQWAALNSEQSERRWQIAAYDFRNSVTRAKERLSREGVTEATVRVPPPVERDLKVTRAEFEELIRADIDATVAELERTITDAGVTVERLRAIYLAGGSSRIPLVTETIKTKLGKEPDTLGDPKSVIARGAVRASKSFKSTPPPEPPTEPVVPPPIQPPTGGGTTSPPPPDPKTNGDGSARRRNKRVLVVLAVVLVLLVGAVIAVAATSGSGGSGGGGNSTTNTATNATQSN